MQTLTSRTLDGIATSVAKDPGLIANTSAADIAGGVAAAQLMNEVIAEAIAATKVNEDGNLSTSDLRMMSKHIRQDDDLYAKFVEGHGDDDGNDETGFHLVQGDGGTLQFQGRDYVDTVADAIYHVGFRIVDGRFQNEDGNANERVDDVAGWMNFFVNGENAVYGSGKSETLNSGEYSDAFADAENETFYARGGHDKVWAGDGDDIVWAGSGNDIVGGHDGNDVLNGEGGHDKLWAGAGDDIVNGGNGNDISAGHDGNDIMNGGRGRDALWGNDGDDTLNGDQGRDKLGGGDGNDIINGGAGRDRIWGNDGDDIITGGAGRDDMHGGEGVDTFVFNAGDSGVKGRSRDVIKGFDSGEDKIDLTSFGTVDFLEGAAFTGAGGAEARIDGDELQVDADGDGVVDMAVEMKWSDTLVATDFA
jgi:Ca2+-binding RTX toxin-like protein